MLLLFSKKCKLCTKQFVSKANYHKHVAACHSALDKTYKCPLCSSTSTYSTTTNLTKHIIAKHKHIKKARDVAKNVSPRFVLRKTTPSKSRSKWKCVPCKKTFARKANYQYHFKAFHSVRHLTSKTSVFFPRLLVLQLFTSLTIFLYRMNDLEGKRMRKVMIHKTIILKQVILMQPKNNLKRQEMLKVKEKRLLPRLLLKMIMIMMTNGNFISQTMMMMRPAEISKMTTS